MNNFEITTLLKKNPKFKKKKWEEIKNKILGKNYELSLVFIGNKKSKSLNKKFRNKDYSANILSFPLEKDSGEIFINFQKVKKEAKKWEWEKFEKKKEKIYRTPENFIDFLFIHGLSHLKGYNHKNNLNSKKMEKFENTIRKKYKV